MRYTARRVATRLASSPKWQAVPLGFLALRSGRVPLLALVVAMAALGLVIH